MVQPLPPLPVIYKYGKKGFPEQCQGKKISCLCILTPPPSPSKTYWAGLSLHKLCESRKSQNLTLFLIVIGSFFIWLTLIGGDIGIYFILLNLDGSSICGQISIVGYACKYIFLISYLLALNSIYLIVKQEWTLLCYEKFILLLYTDNGILSGPVTLNPSVSLLGLLAKIKV